FYFRLTELLENHQGDTKTAVLLIDLNDFKGINDNYGHKAGDDILREVAARLRKHTRKANDLVARLGGDEFGIILHTVKGAQATNKLITRLRKQLEEPLYTLPSGKQIALTVSI